MIKAVSKVEVHFFLVYLGVFEHQTGTLHAPQDSTPKFNHLDNMYFFKSRPYVEEKCASPDYPSFYLQYTVLTQKTQPTTHHSLFLLNPSLPARFPAVAGHFSLEPSSLKSDDAHLTSPWCPPTFTLYIPHGPPRSPQPTAYSPP